MSDLQKSSGERRDGSGSRRTRYRRHGKHSKRKSSFLKLAFKWLRRNPTKAIAFVLLFVLIYLTILFFTYNNKKTLRDRNTINSGK
jgi:hypothetical protein